MCSACVRQLGNLLIFFGFFSLDLLGLSLLLLTKGREGQRFRLLRHDADDQTGGPDRGEGASFAGPGICTRDYIKRQGS